jgi:hypothetical protein
MRLIRTVAEGFPAESAVVVVGALIDEPAREVPGPPLTSLNMTGCVPRRRLIKATCLN